MKIKALKSFSGTVTMSMNEIKDIEDKIAENLIAVKYAVAVTVEPKAEENSDNQKQKNTVKKKSDKDEA